MGAAFDRACQSASERISGSANAEWTTLAVRESDDWGAGQLHFIKERPLKRVRFRRSCASKVYPHDSMAEPSASSPI
jgi:hypothetical protein